MAQHSVGAEEAALLGSCPLQFKTATPPPRKRGESFFPTVWASPTSLVLGIYSFEAQRFAISFSDVLAIWMLIFGERAISNFDVELWDAKFMHAQ